MKSRSGASNIGASFFCACLFWISTNAHGLESTPGGWLNKGSDSSCAAWRQSGPESDRSGFRNTNFPEASSTTYWSTQLSGNPGEVVVVKGRYPFARFTALELYTTDMLVDHLADVDIQPDPGQSNPYVSGAEAGTYTVTVLYGSKPSNPAPNTLYTGTLTSVTLMYRIYHSTDPTDPAGGATNPVLPTILVRGQPLVSCPVQPFLEVENVTPWGRLDDADFIGSAPSPDMQIPAFDPPVWFLADPYEGHYFPNGANYYLGTILSREFLQPNTDKALFVVRLKAPTFPNTRRGEPVYADRQVHFWSMCTDDPYTTNVNRCMPDDRVVLDDAGFATFVFSDRSTKPADWLLTKFKANWIALGALKRPTDVVYDRAWRPWGIDTPVHYYNVLVYRQTLAAPSFTQSFANVIKLPQDQWVAAMGDYWPVGGYCSSAAFAAVGYACTGR